MKCSHRSLTEMATVGQGPSPGWELKSSGLWIHPCTDSLLELESGPSPNPPLRLLHPFSLCITSPSSLLFSLVYVLSKQALLSFFLIFQCLSYFLILFLSRPIQHSGALKCVSSTSTFFRIPPSQNELIFEDVLGGCSREIGNRFLLR